MCAQGLRVNSSSGSAQGDGGDTPPVQKTFLSMVSSSGSRVFKIEGYSRTKDGLGGGIISSPVFVVEGHDWQIKYYPSPSWASVSLVLVATDGARVPVNASFRLLKHSGGSWLDSSYGENLKAGTDVSLQSYMCEQRRAKNAGLSMTKDAVLVGNGLELGLGEPEIMAQLRLDQWACLKDDCLKVRCDITLKDHHPDGTHFVSVARCRRPT